MHDLCLIQEHWLHHNHLNSLNLSNDVLSVAVSGMDDNDLILRRPFGGCGIIYCKSPAPFIRRIYSPSKCFCAVSVTLSNTCYHSNVNLLICVSSQLTTALSTLILCLLKLLVNLKVLFSVPLLIVCGDFNVDLIIPVSVTLFFWLSCIVPI